MRNFNPLFTLLFVLGLVGLPQTMQGQCVPDPQYTSVGIFPDSATGLDPGCTNTPYSEVITVIVGYDTLVNAAPLGNCTVRFNFIRLDSVTGLPPGLTWSTNVPNNEFQPFLGPSGPAQPGCAVLTGTPTTPGVYPLQVHVTAQVCCGSGGGLCGLVPTTDQPSVITDYTIVIGEVPLLTTTMIPDTCSQGVGAAGVSITGGLAPIDVLWQPGGQNTAVILNQTVGSQTVYVNDVAGCIDSATVVITDAGVPPSLTTASTPASCGQANGSATVTATGTGPFTYAWNDPGSQTTSTAFNLPGGSYICNVTDANNCISQAIITVSGGSNPIIQSVSTNNASCNGASDGSATVTMQANVGTPPYTYAWSNGGSGATISNFTAGTYSLTVTDANGCNVTGTGVVITQPTAIQAVIQGTDASCNGLSDGSADLTPSGGTPNYSFLWSNGATTEDISGLAAGTFTVTITDANGCTQSRSVVISQPNPTSLTTTVQDATCQQNNGSVTANPVGTGPFTYAWSNGGTTATITGLGAGAYTVTVTDGNNCPVTATGNVNSAGGPIITSVSGNDPLCNGANTGTATVNVQPNSGTPPYTYAWSSGGSGVTETGLAAGAYSVTVSDALNCPTIGNVTLGQPAAVSGILSGTNISCNGGSDGAVDLTPSGGNASYTYLWSNGTTTQDLNNVMMGTYTVTISDGNACIGIDSISLTEPSALNQTLIGTDVSCNGLSDGSADLTTSGGTPPYNWSWSTGDTTEDVTGLMAGTYSVSISDANNCPLSASVTISEPAAINLGLVGTNVSCNGLTDGSVDLTGSGGTAPFTFSWSNGDTLEDLSGLMAGTYSVILTDGNGCTETDTVVVAQPAALMGSITSVRVSCNGLSDGAVDLTVAGGTGVLTYLWSNGATSEDLSGVSAGSYTVTVSDVNNCSWVDSVIVNEPQAISLSVTSTDETCLGCNDGSALINPTGGSTPFSYSWSSGDSTNFVANMSPGTYFVTVTDANGCSDTTTVVIGVFVGLNNPGDALEVSISPNPNQGSFTLEIKELKGEKVEILLFDLYGKEMYARELIDMKDFSEKLKPAGMAAGIYFLRVRAGTRMGTYRIVVQ